MKKNYISIIIPYHRKKKYFQQTINSIYNQTYKKFEIIVIYDDDSEEELKFVIEVLSKKKNKKLIINSKKIGAGLSRNKAIRFASGEFIAFCDADDVWNRNKLKYQIMFMKKNKIFFSHTSYYIIDKNGKKISNFIIPNKIKKSDLVRRCDIALSSVMCSKKILKNLKFFNTKTKEDYYLWLNLINKTNFFLGINKNLLSWRNLNNSLSSAKMQGIFDAFKVYQVYLKSLFVLPFFYTIRLIFNTLTKKIKLYINFL